jgi:hypothetical protein
MLRDFIFRLRALFRPTSVEAELDDELQFHFDHEILKRPNLGLCS